MSHLFAPGGQCIGANVLELPNPKHWQQQTLGRMWINNLICCWYSGGVTLEDTLES